MTFLRCRANKAELLRYLLNIVVKEIKDKVVVAIGKDNIVTNGAGLEISSFIPCNLEEADEGIFFSCSTYSRRTRSKNDHES